MRPLFGGAMRVSLPEHEDATWLDVATFRQVPDNQEVLVKKSTDQSIIVELLEIPDDDNADLNTDNDGGDDNTGTGATGATGAGNLRGYRPPHRMTAAE